MSEYGSGELDDLLAEAKRRGTKLQRNRRTLVGGGLGAVVIVILVAVFFATRPAGTVLQVTSSPSGGSATPTGATSPTPLQAGGATTQRQVAVYSALLHYELGLLESPPTSTTGVVPVYVSSQLFTITSTGTPVGALTPAVQQGIVAALPGKQVSFVSDVQTLPPVPCGSQSAGFTMELGPVPAAGSTAKVFLSEADRGGMTGFATTYGLSLEGGTWKVTGTTGPGTGVGGTCPESPTPAFVGSQDAATQRQVAIYAALLGYELSALEAPPTSTAAVVPVYIDTQLYTGTSGDRPVGTLSPVVQRGIVAALPDQRVSFLSANQPAPQVSCGAEGEEYSLTLGPVASTGSTVQVFLKDLDVGATAGSEKTYVLSLEANGWTVTGTTGPSGSILGGC